MATFSSHAKINLRLTAMHAGVGNRLDSERFLPQLAQATVINMKTADALPLAYPHFSGIMEKVATTLPISGPAAKDLAHDFAHVNQQLTAFNLSREALQAFYQETRKKIDEELILALQQGHLPASTEKLSKLLKDISNATRESELKHSPVLMTAEIERLTQKIKGTPDIENRSLLADIKFDHKPGF